jgi:hypothetical protein
MTTAGWPQQRIANYCGPDTKLSLHIYIHIHTLQVRSYLQFNCNTILDVTGCEYNYISDIYSYKMFESFRIIINVQWCKVTLEQIRFKYSNASILSEVQFICKIIQNSARSYEERFLVGGSSAFSDDIFQFVCLFDEVDRVVLRVARIAGDTWEFSVTRPCVILKNKISIKVSVFVPIAYRKKI